MIRPSALLYLPALCLALMVGCNQLDSQQPFYFFEDGDLSHYLDKATTIDVPDVDVPPLEDVERASAPISLSNAENVEMWNLSLEDAMQVGLKNSRVMRSLGATLTSPESLTASPDIIRTMYDPAIVESDPRYGVEAALSAFDAQFTSSFGIEKVDHPSNVVSSSLFVQNNNQDLGTFNAGIAKYNKTGGWSKISTNTGYSYHINASSTRQWATDWNTDVTAEFRQPLFQGNGVQFNGISGIGSVPGYYNGPVIARIREDIALTDFEASVRQFVADLETAYWELYLAYRELDSVAAGYHSSLETWKQAYARAMTGAQEGQADREAQAREQLYLFRAQVEQRRTNLYTIEAQLRYLMGITSADGRLIRPSDEPTTAKVDFDWYEAQSEALVRNVSLRRQGWSIKKAEMEEIASKNFLLPRVDAVGLYRWYGMGNKLWDTSTQGMTTGLYNNAMESLTSGNYQEYEFGIQAEIPIGFRKEHAGVRNAQLTVARQKTVLREMELEVTHQLAAALRQMDLNNQLIHTNFNRRNAAKRSVEAVQASYNVGTVTINVLLDQQRRLAEAEVEFYRSIVSYNLAIMDVHFRKGSLLEYNNIYLAEGPWPGKAYFDARQRARERDAGLYLDYGFTRPKVFSRGAYNQHPTVLPMDENGTPIYDGTESYETVPGENVPHRAAPEVETLPAPAPEPGMSGSNGLLPTSVANRTVEGAHGLNLFSRASSPQTLAQSQNQGQSQAQGPAETRLAQVPDEQGSRQIVDSIKPISEVRLVNHEEPVDGWKSVKDARANDENQANRTSSSTSTSSAGGWKRL